jgi:peptidoglycan hydrolase-like protein with peptidoglycan-binding domain
MTKTTTIELQRNAYIFLAMSVVSLFTLFTLLFFFPKHSYAAMLSQQLELGMSNADVTSLQVFLAANRTIYPEGSVTGYFGPLTKAAVIRFQNTNGISAVGRVGPQTLAVINAQMNGGTGGGDDTAPIMYPETVTPGTNSFTVNWTVSEASMNRVMYGTTWPFLYSTAPSFSNSGFNSTANITVTGLQSHTTYYYVLESVDPPGNIMWTLGKPVTTQ